MDRITADPGQIPDVMTSSATEPGSQENEHSLPASHTPTRSAPVSITVNSAFKTMKIKDTNPISGNIFIGNKWFAESEVLDRHVDDDIDISRQGMGILDFRGLLCRMDGDIKGFRRC